MGKKMFWKNHLILNGSDFWRNSLCARPWNKSLSITFNLPTIEKKNQSHPVDSLLFYAFCAVLRSLLIVCFNSSFAGAVFLSLSENHIFIYSSSRIEWKKNFFASVGLKQSKKNILKWSSFSHFIGNWFLTLLQCII